MGKGLNAPRKAWKSALGATKNVPKKQVGVINSPAADVPGVFPNLAVPVGVPEDVAKLDLV